MTQRYRALSSADYALVSLDMMSALYDRRSGQTHLVAPPVPEILAIMQEGDVNAAELVARLAAHYDLPAGEDHIASVEARMSELAALGLVEMLP